MGGEDGDGRVGRKAPKGPFRLVMHPIKKREAAQGASRCRVHRPDQGPLRLRPHVRLAKIYA